MTASGIVPVEFLNVIPVPMDILVNSILYVRSVRWSFLIAPYAILILALNAIQTLFCSAPQVLTSANHVLILSKDVQLALIKLIAILVSNGTHISITLLLHQEYAKEFVIINAMIAPICSIQLVRGAMQIGHWLIILAIAYPSFPSTIQKIWFVRLVGII